ncbi:MAG: molecular chaperone TorD family protein [Chloroflexi bacterium]|nr:molecular chaperone TorD family protein [Chloroflexota bacterium]
MAGKAHAEPTLADLARLRQGTYRLLSVLLLHPRSRTVAAVPGAASYLLRRRSLVTSLAFYPSWEGLLHRLTSVTPAQESILQEEFGSLFVAGGPGGPVPLSEAAHLDPTGASSGPLLADLDRAYAAAGLRSSPGGSAPDHVSVELEFVSSLCGQEAEAWSRGKPAVAADALWRQHEFLHRHLCCWLPALASGVAARRGQGYYRGVVQLARDLAAHDVDFVVALAARVETAMSVVSGGPSLMATPFPDEPGHHPGSLESVV